MNIRRLAVVKSEKQTCAYGLVGEMEDGRHIYLGGGFYALESAILNAGALLGRYNVLFLYDNEWPVDTTRAPDEFSIRGQNRIWNDTDAWSYRTYWIQPEYDIIHWFDWYNVLVS